MRDDIKVLDNLTEDEAYLFAILSDPSGLDQAEFLWTDHSCEDNIKEVDGEKIEVRPSPSGCFRAWSYQWPWWRDRSPLQIDQCVAGGQLVLARSGWVPVERIKEGDQVLTHENRWRRVTKTWRRGPQAVVRVTGQGHPGLVMTGDHPLWARASRRGSKARDGHRGKILSDPTWMTPAGWEWNDGSERMTANWAVSPVVLTGAPLPVPIERTAWCDIDYTDPAFLWLFGHFIAQGSTFVPPDGANHLTYRSTWSCHPERVELVEAMFRKLGIEPYVEYRDSVTCLHVTLKPLTLWLRAQAGHLAHNKQLPHWVMGLEHEQRRAVFEGMGVGDGHVRKAGRIEYTTASWQLALSFKILAASLGYGASLRQQRVAGECVIEGRTVNRRDCWGVDVELLREQRKARCVIDAGHLWAPLNKVTPAGTADVYDLEVEEDHSFVVEGVVVHNCARSVGKSLSIKVRGCAFPFLYPGQEMIITAPELVHLEPIVSLIESQMYSTRTLRELLPKGKSAVTHRPFQMNFLNGSRIIGRIPQRDGKGVKGCSEAETLILTTEGHKRADEIRVGDQVLTHTGRYAPVTAVFEDENDCYEVRGQSSFPMIVSCDHRFLGAENTATPKQKRNFLPLAWHDVEFLTEHQVYWATPTTFPDLPIPWPDAPFEMRSSLADFWWLVGRYLADGYLTERRVNWCVPEKKTDALMAALGTLGVEHARTERSHSSADVLSICSTSLSYWLFRHFGKLADGKKLPAWALGMEPAYRQALLDGYLAGDGWFCEDKKRWEVGTASKALAIGVQLLAQSLGYTVNCTSVRPKVTHICGTELKAEPKTSWRLQIGYGHPAEIDDYLVGKVKSVEPVGKRKVYNIVVDGDHSYLTGSIMSHNIHPIWLELDEAQDYPHAGWVELNETLKRGWQGATWRAHGVTRGVRDDFYEYTQDTNDNPWRVHRFAAMWRPNWTDREREEAMQKYGSREDPDYRRNVLGLHGDKTNPIFVLTQLMKNVDSDPLTEYNTGEYFKVPIKSEQLELFEQEITDVLDFPPRHLDYVGKTPRERLDNPKAHFWVGMDIGFTIDPSEILVFCEYRKKPTDDRTVLRLLTRISMTRMPHRQQIQAILHTIDFYRPRAFAMDKGGLGLPLFQELSEHIEAFRARNMDRLPAWMHVYDLEAALVTIKGYNFSEKLLVDLDPSIEVGPYATTDDLVQKSGMKRNAKEYSTDVLREMVDRQQLWLPWDDDLLKQFQGGTWMSNKSMDAYSRRVFSRGNDHVLDAARMMALGWSLNRIEEMTKKPVQEPVYDAFITL